MSFYRPLQKLKITPIKKCGRYEDEKDINTPGAFACRVKKVTLPRKKPEKFNIVPTEEGKCPKCQKQKDMWIPGPDGSFNRSDFNMHCKRCINKGQYQCQYCPVRKDDSSGLRNHIKEKHDITWWRCNDCVYKATSSRRLSSHIANKHMDLPDLSKTCPKCQIDLSGKDGCSHWVTCSGLSKQVIADEVLYTNPIEA